MTFEEKMAQAFKETFDERTEHLMKIEKKHRFSLAYKLWERKTLRDLRRNRVDKCWTLKKSKAVLASGIAAVFVLAGGTTFAAVNLGRYNFVDKHDYSKMLIEAHPSDKTTLEEYYGLPEEDGWVIDDFYADNYDSTIMYTRDDIKVTFVQSVIHEGNMGQISTDRAKIEPLSLYEENDGFVLEFDGGALIYWIYDGYLLEMSGNLDKNEAINLAKSTKIVNFPKKF